MIIPDTLTVLESRAGLNAISVESGVARWTFETKATRDQFIRNVRMTEHLQPISS
jgi:hypothetical protein